MPRYTKYILEIDGEPLGSYVNGISMPRPVRANDVQKRVSLWNTNVILDGRWPQITWETDIAVYHEEATRELYAAWVMDLSDILTHDPKSVQVLGNEGDSSSTIDFGLCYITEMSMDTPNQLLLYEAGIHIFSIIGTLKPSIS